jgi:FSR family fosmidomycin resistance protein-like MFS transporter
MTVLAVGHLCNDLYQGAVPALLPFLVAARGLSYTAAAGLVLAATVISSLVQPALGHYSDRRPLPWLLPAGVLVGALGLALAGLAPWYPLLCGGIILSGLGVAAFHPDAARLANHVSGQRRATGMSLFAVAGNAGFALGPLAVTPLVLRFGLPGVGFLLAPAALLALLLAAELPRLMSFRPALAAGGSGRPVAPAREMTASARLAVAGDVPSTRT